MKKRMMLLLAALALLFLAGCQKAEDSAHFPTSVKIAENEPEEGQAKPGLFVAMPLKRLKAA